MGILKIVFKNIKQRSLASLLTIFSIMLGVALVTSIILLRKESEDAFNQTATGYELIVGPKGSSLQLTLNTVYQIGVPLGNMPFRVYELLKNDKRVKLAIPYVSGDNFKNFRLIGTVPEIFTEFEYHKGKKYNISSGKFFENDFEAVIGSETSLRTGLKIGDTFTGSHGVDSYEGAETHDEFRFKVTGILEKTFSPVDRLIFVSMNSVWKLHNHEMENDTASASTNHNTITSILLKLKNPVYFDLVRRQINDDRYEGISAQAILPVFEIKQLFDIIGNINSILLVIAYLVIFVSAISVLVSLYNSMNERRREIAIMRSLGASRFTILKIIVMEGVIISLCGSLSGLLLGHSVLIILKNKISDLAGIQITGTTFSITELYIFAGTVLLGMIASLLPALKAYKTDVAENLNPVS